MTARAPNHLGDGVVALPAMHALARLGRLVIHGPRWAPELYRDVDAEVRPRGRLEGDVAVLFAPSLRAAFEARGVRRRIGTATDGRRALLTDVVPAGIHPAETYAALAAAAGAVVEGPPRWAVRGADPRPDVPADHVGLNPISVSGRVRQWTGFGALAERIDGPVVVYGGPGEDELVRAAVPRGVHAVGLSLAAFAGALQRCRLFVSNDSGAAHFAAAVGVRVLVVYGSTAPRGSGPYGAEAVRGPMVPCSPCWRRSCPYGLECFDIAVDDVIAATKRSPTTEDTEGHGGAPGEPPPWTSVPSVVEDRRR